MNYPAAATTGTLADAQGLQQKGYAVPYSSLKQSRYMHAQHPQIAKRWDKETSDKQWKAMPRKVMGIKGMCGGTMGKRK